jgi:hypothetical protein
MQIETVNQPVSKIDLGLFKLTGLAFAVLAGLSVAAALFA